MIDFDDHGILIRAGRKLRRIVDEEVATPDNGKRVSVEAIARVREKVLHALESAESDGLHAVHVIYEYGFDGDHLTPCEDYTSPSGAECPDMVIGVVYEGAGGLHAVVWPLGAERTGPFKTMNEVRAYLALVLRNVRGK